MSFQASFLHTWILTQELALKCAYSNIELSEVPVVPLGL